MQNYFINTSGLVDFYIVRKDGFLEYHQVKNRILLTGRNSLAKALANSFGSTFEYFVTNMAFGSGGTSGGSVRYVDDTRNGLFGPTVLTKPVISSIDSDSTYKVIFTSVVTFDEAVGEVINEIGLKMKSGEFFSMATFGDITKTADMQLTFNWSCSFV